MEIDESYFNKKIQKAINKLISEEWFAGNMYKFYFYACDQNEREIVEEVFLELSEDEIEDHMKSMADWAMKYGYYIPCSLKDFQKYAGEVSIKLFNQVKKEGKPEELIKKAIEAETDAIASYEEVLQMEELQEFGDLNAILLRNYNDEIEHLDKLNTLLYQLELV